MKTIVSLIADIGGIAALLHLTAYVTDNMDGWWVGPTYIVTALIAAALLAHAIWQIADWASQ